MEERISSFRNSSRRNSSLLRDSLSRCNSNTSQITIQGTQHLQGRKRERNMTTSLLQHTRKYGDRRRQRNGNILFRSRHGAHYVTDRSGRVGVTCWQRSSKRRRVSGPRGGAMAPPPSRSLAPRRMAPATMRRCVACGDVGFDRRMLTCERHQCSFHSFCVAACPQC